MLDGLGFESGWGQDIFFSITAVVPTQIYIQWVMGFLLGVKRPGCQVSHYLHPVSRLRMTGTIAQRSPYAFMVWTEQLYVLRIELVNVTSFI
jgi:hypothetical protein